MRILIVSLAVLVLVVASPALAGSYNYFKGGSIGAKEGVYSNPNDWGTWTTDWGNETGGWTGSGYVPGDGQHAVIRGNRTVHIRSDVALGSKRFRLGYTQAQMYNDGGFGNVIMEADPGTGYTPNVSAAVVRVGLWTWWHDGAGNPVPVSTWTQTAGTLTATSAFHLGRGDDVSGPPGYPVENGSGNYLISGGTLNAAEMVIGLFHFDSAVDVGLGAFTVIGDAPVINGASYTQNAISKTKIVLTGAGNVSLINIAGDATLEGTLEVDASAFAGTKTIDVLAAAGVLDYSGLSLDSASQAAGYVLGDDGAGTLQVTVPEPATMTLLGLGGLGVLLRRRKK